MSPCGSTEEDNYAQCINRNMGKCTDPEPMQLFRHRQLLRQRGMLRLNMSCIYLPSLKCSKEQFVNIKKAVQKPIINNYYEENPAVVLAFIFPYTPPDREWVYDRDSAVAQLEEAEYRSSTLEIIVNNQSTATAHMESPFYPPRLILITDFVSIIFTKRWLAVDDNAERSLSFSPTKSLL
uniref:Uncharacterized protein n=1 Tax=Ditylenchus dipsaci TaxID=166011 RepID=A0A915D5G4_9BILA